MGKYNSVFQRIEKKYVLTKEQYPAFLERIAPYMTLDQYGYHAICNIYYDTEEDELIRRSMEKPRYKEKLRLRTYGVATPDQEAFVEIKKKYEKVVYKRRVALPYKDAVRYLNHGIHPEKSSQILKEIDYFRLTIDHNIRYREDNLDLTAGDQGELYFENDEKILEIKVAQSFPMWLTEILADLKIYPNSFSKYGSIFTKTHLHSENDGGEVPYRFVSGGV